MEHNHSPQEIEKKIDSMRDQLNSHLSFSEKVELKARMMSLKKWLDEHPDDYSSHRITIEQLLDTTERLLNSSKKA